MRRKLRITAAYSCYALVIALLVLWNRSSSRTDVFVCDAFFTDGFWMIGSGSQHLGVAYLERHVVESDTKFKSEWGFQSSKRTDPTHFPPAYFARGSANWEAAIANWLVTPVIALLAFFLKPKPRFRFALSELLVLITIAALTAGVITAIFHTPT